MEEKSGPQIVGDDAEDTQLLKEMAAEAREYLQSYDWCPPIRGVALGFGVGGVMALFRVEFTEAIDDTDQVLWVVVGDLPSAYFVYEGNEHPAAALEQYCGLMEDWAMAVRRGASVDECFPVDAPETRENAEALLSRMAFIRNELVPRARS